MVVFSVPNLAIAETTIPTPLAEYRFDECSWNGTTSGEVKDQTGNFNATSKNGASITTGKINNGGSFDGIDDHIQLPTINGGFSEGITISAWVDFGAVNDYERVVELSSGLCDGDWCSNDYISLWRGGDSDKLHFQIRQGTDNAGNHPTTTILEGMHHYVATYDHNLGKAKIYVDGTLKDTQDYDTSKFDPNAIRDHNYIGKTVWDEEDGNSDIDYPFGGKIDEVKIYNGALSDSEVQDLYNNENAGRNYNDDTNTRDTITCSFCDKVVDVNKTECEALVSFYDNTNGDNWKDKTNWKTSTTVNDWYGVWVWDGHVKTILLDDNNLTGEIPAKLGDLTELKTLSLTSVSDASYKLYGSIPSELGNLVNLEKLQLRYNNLTGNIPPEIGNLTKLINFSVHHNDLNGTIPANLSNLTNLKYLYLEGNNFTGNIPSELSSLTQLHIFNISDNNFTGLIPEFLKDVNTSDGDQFWEGVDVYNNNFTFVDIEPHYQVIVDAIGTSNNAGYDCIPQNKVDEEREVYFILNSTLTIVPETSENRS
jgi:hypothetical protein